MNEQQKPTNWWQTLPGVLTAIAAVITAISGLVALLFQNGVLGGKADSKIAAQTTPQVVAHSNAENRSIAASAEHAATRTTARPWSEAEAVLLSRDGATTRVRAASFSNCISVDHEISLDDGQSIPFEKLASFEVIQADDHTAPNPKAKLKLTLPDGAQVSGTVDAGCDLFGYNDLGRFSTYFDHLQSVRFE